MASSSSCEANKVVVTTSTAQAGEGGNGTKSLSVLDGVAFVVATCVGSGMFFSPGVVAQQVGSPCGSLLSFLVGGIISLCGALCYSELGTTYISAGAESHYLKKAFGDATGFAFCWTCYLVIGSGACAAVSIVLGSYFVQAFGFDSDSYVWSTHIAGIISIWIIFAVNVFLPSRIAAMNRFMFWLKIGTSLCVGAGALFGSTTITETPFLYQSGGCFANTNWGAEFLTSISFTLFAFAGWNFASSLTEELENPSRGVPKMFFFGMLITVFTSILFCLSFFSVLPYSQLTETAGSAFASAISENLRPYFSIMVALCCFGSSSGNWIGAVKIAQSASASGNFPSIFGRLCGVNNLPLYSMIIFTSWCSFLVFTVAAAKAIFHMNGLVAITNFWIVGQYLFFFLVTLGLIRLRFKDSERHRPYSVTLYPLTPLIFILASSCILINVTLPRILKTAESNAVQTKTEMIAQFLGLSGDEATGFDLYSIIGFLIAAIGFGVGRRSLYAKKNLKVSKPCTKSVSTSDDVLTVLSTPQVPGA